MCIPTRTFSSAVMFWKSRMFWNVRPIPADTMSFGRALRKIPIRPMSRWYRAGRATAARSITINAASVSAPPMKATEVSFTLNTAIPLRIPTTTAGRNQTNGSSQVRMGRATIVRSLTRIRPLVGS